MWLSKGMEHTHLATFTRRGSYFLDREFQVRYISLVLAAATLGAALNLVLIYYFLEQNYTIFFELAFSQAPQMLEHLERERFWIRAFSLGSFLSIVTFFGFVGFKMTSRIVGPLKVLRNHLKQVSRGNWRQQPIKVRDDDEFQDLVEAYNYFFSSYQANLQRDLQRLHALNIDSSNRDAYFAWKQMIEEKSSQLGVVEKAKSAPTASGASTSATPGSRRAS
ncbi:MAG: HAMP domain-containing protein [Bdellovibrionales bacterium]|nr:HAMP domain-containing protein [Bdellovibrionales bacterium]